MRKPTRNNRAEEQIKAANIILPNMVRTIIDGNLKIIGGVLIGLGLYCSWVLDFKLLAGATMLTGVFCLLKPSGEEEFLGLESPDNTIHFSGG